MYEELAKLFFGTAIFFLVILVIVIAIFHVRKTKQYRREVSDLYVAGKIRQIAEKDGVDLAEEKLAFLDWSKREKLSQKDYNYDDSVEEEMKGKIEEDIGNLKKNPKKDKK